MCSEPAGMSRNGCRQQLGVSMVARFIAFKMAFTRDAAHHQRARSHQARPHPANAADECTKPRAHSYQQILVKQEKRLYGTDMATSILYEEISVVELGMEC